LPQVVVKLGSLSAYDALLGASTLDRLRHAAYRLVFDGKSYRTPRGENDDKSSLEKGHENTK